MIARQDRYDLVFAHYLRPQIVVVRRFEPTRKSQIDLPLHQRLPLRRRGHLDQRQPHSSMLLPEAANDCRKINPHTPRKEPDTQGSNLTALSPLYLLYCLCRGSENTLRLRQKDCTCRGQRRISGTAVKERYANLALHVCNLLTDGRLRDIQRACRPAKTAQFGNGHKVSKVTQLHSLILSVFPMVAAGNNCETFACRNESILVWPAFGCLCLRGEP